MSVGDQLATNRRPIIDQNSERARGYKCKGQTSENFAEQNKFAENISEAFSEDRRYHFYTGFQSISGCLRNLRGRLLSSEKFSEAFTLWVFTTLKPFPECVTISRVGLRRPTTAKRIGN